MKKGWFDCMENYKLIDMFDKLDAAVLEDLHLEKDLKRQQNLIRKLFARGHINIARMIAAHHARTDWGAIIDLNQKDLENYVYFVHHIDDLSAKFGKISASML